MKKKQPSEETLMQRYGNDFVDSRAQSGEAQMCIKMSTITN